MDFVSGKGLGALKRLIDAIEVANTEFAAISKKRASTPTTTKGYEWPYNLHKVFKASVDKDLRLLSTSIETLEKDYQRLVKETRIPRGNV